MVNGRQVARSRLSDLVQISCLMAGHPHPVADLTVRAPCTRMFCSPCMLPSHRPSASLS